MCLKGRTNSLETLRDSKAEANVSKREFSLHKACGPTSLASYCGTFTIWAGQCAIARSSRERRRKRCSLTIYSFLRTCTHITKHSLGLRSRRCTCARSIGHTGTGATAYPFRLSPPVYIYIHSRPTCHNPRPPKMRSALWRRGAPLQPSLNYTRSRNQR